MYLKEHLWVAASAYFSIEASQGELLQEGTYFLEEYLFTSK